MSNLDPLLISLLLLLIGLLAVLSSILSNRLSERHSSSTRVYLIFCLAVVCATVPAFVGWLLSSPPVNKDIYYWVLGIGFLLSLTAVTVLLTTKAKSTALTPSPTPLRSSNVQTRHKLLDDVSAEVAGRLAGSLHNAVLINLLKEKLPEQVECKWAVEVKIGNQPSTQLAPTTKMIEVFDSSAIAGKLLILGAPGAGKTTTLLEITRELCVRALNNSNEPIPVLFNLAAWQDEQPVADWLVAELKQKWGIRADIGKYWLETRQILPLLDGLDELETEHQEQCVQAINQFLKGYYSPKYIIVCSRQHEYELYNTQLQLNGAVCLQPLTYAQIHDYLVDVKRPQLWQMIKREPTLLKLVKSPLLLSLITLVYEEISLVEWQKYTSPFSRRQYLFDTYVELMLKREINHRWYIKGKEPSSKQTKRWLVWLANTLKYDSRDEFLIEKMQPTLLLRSQRLMYHLAVGLFSGLTIGVFGGLSVKLSTDEPSGQWLIFGLVAGLISGIVIGLRKNITTVETVKWSGVKAKRGMGFGSVIGLMYGVFGGLTFKLIYDPDITLNEILLFGLACALIYSLVGAAIGILIGGLSGPDIEKRTTPNQGIWRSAVNTGTFAVVGWLIFGLIVVLLKWQLLRESISTYTIISSGLLGMLIGAVVPGTACIQHFTLRLLLWRHGHIPWNYARFLDYGTERLFLQRVGGRYRFIHDLLREHFSQMALY